MRKYEFIIYKKVENKLKSDWNSLWKRSKNATIFNSYQWFEVSCRTLNVKNIKLYTCWDHGKLVAIMPAYDKKHFGIRVTAPLVYKHVSTPILTENYNKDLVSFYFGNLVKHKNIYISKISQELTDILRQRFSEGLFYSMSANPILNKKNDPNIFSTEKHHKNIKKILRKNKTLLEFKKYEKSEELTKYLKLIFQIEQASTKKQHNKDLFSKQKNRLYFESIVRYCGDFVKIFILYYKGEPIAYDFVFEYADVFYGYQCAYMSGYEKLSPGMLITLLEMKFISNSSNLNYFDLGGGMSYYKQRFTTDYYVLFDFLYSKHLFIRAWWKAIIFARRTRQILFPEKFSDDYKFLFKTL